MGSFWNCFRIFSLFFSVIAISCSRVDKITPYCRHRVQGDYTHPNHDWENIKGVAECGYNVLFDPIYEKPKEVDKKNDLE